MNLVMDGVMHEWRFYFRIRFRRRQMNTTTCSSVAVAALIILMAADATADVHQFSTCKLNAGKTLDELHAVVNRSAAWTRSEKVPQPKTAEVMWPMMGEAHDPGTFFYHVAYADFGVYGDELQKYWDGRLFEQDPAVTSNDVFTCNQVQVFYTAPWRARSGA
jgi:hypothetical protein